MPTLSFKTIFARYGKLLTKFLSDNIVDGGKQWIPFNPATTAGTAGKTKTGKISRKLTSASGNHPRMLLTGRTKANAFKFTAEDTKLTLFIDPKYENIIEGNNKGGNFIRKNQVHLFPLKATESSFEQTPVIQQLKGEVSKEMETYFQNMLNTDISRTIKL